MNKLRLLNILLVALFVALGVTVTYGVQFYRGAQELNSIESPNCAEKQ